MKNLILSALFLAALPFAANSSVVTSATSLKLISADGLTEVQNLTVKLTSGCKYSSGIFWSESKSCGFNTIELKVGADGIVQIPAIEKFKGLHGAKTANYDVSLTITEGKEWIAVVSAYGKEALPKFKFENKPLSIFRVNAANINLSYEGTDFFGSELSKVDRAMLLVSIKDKNYENKINELMTVSPLMSLWSRENLDSYSGKILLKDTKEIDFKNMSYVKFNSSENETIVLNVHYSNSRNEKMNLKGSVELPLSPNALEEIGTIELKK
jgi:hypothetical protein